VITAEIHGAVALAQVTLIFAFVGASIPEECTRAAANQQPGYGLKASMIGSEDPLLVRIRQVCGHSLWEHGPDFTQRERTGEIEEITHEEER
jgi:hypothetical protein